MTSKPIPGEAHAAYGMAGILAAGGLFAMARKSSVKSLVPSLAFAAGYAYSGERIRQGEGAEGHRTATVLGLVLTTAMFGRAFQTKKIYPAGIVALLAAVSGSYHAYKWHLWSS